MTSTRLTQQTRSREWAAALRAATHRPYRPPAPGKRGTRAEGRGNSWHGSDAGSNTTHSTSNKYNHRTAFLPVVLPQGRPCTRPTHAHGWAGGCCVVGRADPVPARSCSGGGETARKSSPGPALSNAIDLPRRKRGRPPSPTKPCLPIINLPIPCKSLSQAGRGRHESGRALLLSPLDLIPPRLAPSWPLR